MDLPPTESSELPQDVLERLPRRDPEALATFFDAWFERVYAFVHRMVPDEHLAEDLTQDVFLLIHRSIGSYDPRRDIRPWVYTMATNRVRDHWRSRRHRDTQSETSIERERASDVVPAPEGRPEAYLERAELRALVQQAVEALPEGMRVTVALRALGGLSFEEIGKIVDRNEVAVRKRYSRALDQLRESLDRSHRVHTEGTP
ncbi:MAG: RNA polymerase sigma factor [Planctomycetota bacterium]|nr:RNA polymerase sigma factor [Planctomycetota bacterium]